MPSTVSLGRRSVIAILLADPHREWPLRRMPERRSYRLWHSANEGIRVPAVSACPQACFARSGAPKAKAFADIPRPFFIVPHRNATIQGKKTEFRMRVQPTRMSLGRRSEQPLCFPKFRQQIKCLLADPPPAMMLTRRINLDIGGRLIGISTELFRQKSGYRSRSGGY